MKIGILVGMENTFPPALIEKINSMNAGVTAEYVKIGGIKAGEDSGYKLIFDRISHEIPFYRSFLKNAVLNGTTVVNNPFWWSADDKFFNYSLATKLGVAVPKTILLPQKAYKQGVTDASLRNLEFPLKWQEMVDYIGLPAIIKPHDGGGWRDVYKIDTLDELWRDYDKTGTLAMTLQEFIDFTHYVRCYCVGRRNVLVMLYDPKNRRYVPREENTLPREIEDRIVRDTLLLNEALGYDFNTVEFAVRDGIPYAIDYMNPAPDADIWSVTEPYFNWVVNAVAEMLVDYAKNGAPTLRHHRWNRFLDQDSGSPAVIRAEISEELGAAASKAKAPRKPRAAAADKATGKKPRAPRGKSKSGDPQS
ncbi:MAG: RimK family alpha-L-glutamate ligase [Blastocatellia bacterium]